MHYLATELIEDTVSIGRLNNVINNNPGYGYCHSWHALNSDMTMIAFKMSYKTLPYFTAPGDNVGLMCYKLYNEKRNYLHLVKANMLPNEQCNASARSVHFAYEICFRDSELMQLQ